MIGEQSPLDIYWEDGYGDAMPARSVMGCRRQDCGDPFRRFPPPFGGTLRVRYRAR